MKSMFSDKLSLPQCVLKSGVDGEVYTEATRAHNKSVEVTVQWNLNNDGEIQWPENMKLRLIKCYPPLDFSAKSKVACLKPHQNGVLLLGINIPANFPYHFMVLHFKLQIGKNLIAPNLLVNMKINTRADPNVDISSFDEKRLAEQQEAKSLEQSLVEISQGNDIYNEDELIRMASLLEEEQYGSFDRCLNLIRALRGDILCARDILSELPLCDKMAWDNTA